MAKKSKKTKKALSGEQLDLIDVLPAKAKPIIKAARIYKKYQLERLSALAKENSQKKFVLQMVKEAKLQPLEGGLIKFTCENVTVSVTPRDELVKIKEQTD